MLRLVASVRHGWVAAELLHLMMVVTVLLLLLLSLLLLLLVGVVDLISQFLDERQSLPPLVTH